MKTILPAKESIAKLWGYPQPKDATYRLMNYLLQMEVEDGILLHNVVTGHLVLLSHKERELLSNLPAKATESMKEMIANHFLVPEDFDECRVVNQLRAIHGKRFTGDAINHYVILPTTSCNAHCFYCYESNYPHVQMTEETGRKVIDYIVEHHQDKVVRLAWFGGEPLLGIDRIDQISRGLKDCGVQFYASMISNGYLFDEEIVEKGVTLWNLQYVQITLDGTEAVYNEVKAFSNASENPYQRVLKNIDRLSQRKVLVVIRLNLDFYNKDDIRTLMGELSKRYADNKYVKVYLSLLYNDQGYEPVHHSEEEYLELLNIYDDYSEQILETNVGVERRKIPRLRVHQCMADDPHSVMIQPNGSLCRCEHESISDRYGSIDEGVLDPKKLLEWKATDNLSSYCPNCRMYPFCYMLSKCMGKGHPCNESIRQSFQKRHMKRLLSVYQSNLEEEENESICDS